MQAFEGWAPGAGLAARTQQNSECGPQLGLSVRLLELTGNTIATQVATED
jgi:hypothetical protein